MSTSRGSHSRSQAASSPRCATEALRQALRLWLQQQQPAHQAVFGLWRDRPEEALDMQQALRAEWNER